MVKLIWMSDIHFAANGDVLGHDPRVRLKAAIDYINAHHGESDGCIITGDMVNRGSADDYAVLSGLLGELTIPYYPMVGNHDIRRLFKEHLNTPENCMDGFVQYAIQTPDGILACLDTLKTGSDAGEFCSARRNWLEELLAKAGSQDVYLFMHHPPMALGLPMQDGDRLGDGGALLDMIERHGCVRHLFIGHVHRPITGTVRGIPFATMRSVLYQAPPPLPSWDWQSFSPATEAPQLGVLSITNGDVNLQYTQVCDYATGT